jgi:hypothetical protein
VNTGFAVYDLTNKKFLSILTLTIHQAIKEVTAAIYFPDSVLTKVRFEDARQRKWYGKNAGTHALQGAGSIKRDCKIWEDFLTELKVPFDMVNPGSVPTKYTAETFKNVTKWKGRTSEHSRDAALLIFQ